MNDKAKKVAAFGAREIATAAVATALLSGGKWALAAIPNVEVVTLLCAVYGYTLGLTGLVAVYAFVAIETAIWGFGSWVLTYFLHWPLVCVSFRLLALARKEPGRILPTVLAFALTVCFSLSSSLVDVTFFLGWEDHPARFAVYYLRGIPFYVAQVVCNLVLFPTLFPPLVRALRRVRARRSP